MGNDVRKKKIRIVSFQNAHNFGAVLQAYGLQQTLQKNGYEDALFLNYNPSYLKDRYNPLVTWNFIDFKASLSRRILRIVKWFSVAVATWTRNYKFNQSIKKLLKQTTKELREIDDFYSEDADILICGSDQIWNISITGNLDPVFFGLPYKNKKVIAYAPSTEIASMSKDTARKMSVNISHFSYVSVREKIFKDYLQPFTSKPIAVCLDPTLLCDVSAFNKIASKRIVKNPYVCIYAYFYDEQIIQEVIKTIPDYESLDIHYILFTATNLYQWKNRSLHSVISVEDFLSYIKYASYVITNSFHGLAFSLLFERNFNVTWKSNKSTRCESLLNELNLNDRLVYSASDAKWNSIDWNTVNVKINRMKSSSLQYLINSINQ